MVKQLMIVIGFVFSVAVVFAQTGTDQQLAQHYYNNGEYAKAKMYYEKLYKHEPSKIHFSRLYECYLAENELKEAEKLIRRQWDLEKSNLEYPVLLGQFYEEHGEVQKAEKLYTGLIDDLKPHPGSIIGLFNAFKAKGKNELAYETISKGRSLLKDSYPLNFQFAEYYGATGQSKKMMDEYMSLLDFNANYQQTIQTILSRQIDFNQKDSEEYILLKEGLLTRAQKNPSNMTYSEMLIWFFIQSKDFSAALIQEQALDKRLNLNGIRVFSLGEMCVQNHEYATARKSFQYVKALGNENPLYYRAENALLNTRFLEITTRRSFSESEINDALADYSAAIERIGKSNRSLPLIIEMCHIQAFYGNQAERAIETLTNALSIPRLTDMQEAEVKMKLADIHVLHGDIWEASLLYMQVDKAFKFETIGQEARFKNARIFYYDGEFDYAQSQLDVLKQGTSKLISNDAIRLSLLITDNYGLDSNYTAMFWFASADLLIEQHRYSEAFQLFDSIMVNFPYHSLGDEILIKKSHAMDLQGKWNEALSYLDELLKYYSEDILADDAWFRKGTIFEQHLFEPEQAMECYKTILLNYKGSLHTTEARKRFRKLRGESVEDDSVEREEEF